MSLPAIEELKIRCHKIHYFGLGFIQLKVSKTERYHFYTTKFPKTSEIEEVHNHRYPFTSYILKGELFHETFDWDMSGMTHVTRDESCDPKIKSTNDGYPCRIWSSGAYRMVAGSVYKLDYKTLHRVQSNDAITQVFRTEEYSTPFARVVTEIGKPTVCPFSITVPESELWNEVEKCLLRKPSN